jgi:hypothetical protein
LEDIMTARRTQRADEATLLDLLAKGDYAGLAKLTGYTIDEIKRTLEGRDDDALEDEEDDPWFLDEDDDEEEDEGALAWRRRPSWLHADCLNVCTALELGTCCKYPDNPLVQRAVELADSVDRTLRRFEGGDCTRAAAELTRQFSYIPGLLAQIQAILPRLNRTAVAQFLCPVGRLRAAADQVRSYGCPWACDDPDVPDRRAEFDPLTPLLAESSAAIRAVLGRPSVRHSGRG